MEHKVYGKYKKTELSFLNSIPKTWNVERLKNIASVNGRVGWKALKASEYVDFSDYIFLATPNIKHKNIDFDHVNYLTKERYEESPEIMLNINDILLAKDGSTLGTVNIVEHLPTYTTVNSSIAVLRLNPDNHARYIFYQIRSNYIQNLISLKKDGAGVPHLFQSDINNFNLILPDFDTQVSIAEFLDKEISVIDKRIGSLTHKKQKYSELKLSVIFEAVTGSLDHRSKKRSDSSEWVGKVPKSWEKYTISDITHVVSEKGYPDEQLLSVYRDYGVLVKNSRNDNHNREGSDLSNYKLVRKGDLVINKMKTWQGSLAVSEHQGIVSPAYIVCKLDQSLVEPLFIHYLLRSRPYICKYAALSYGVRNDQWDIRYHDFKYLPVYLPDKKEQVKISEYLNKETKKIEKIIECIDLQIDRLEELKKVLINDVVTGKVKVT